MGHPVHTPRCSLKDIKVAFIVEQKLKPPIGLYYFEDLLSSPCGAASRKRPSLCT